MWHSRESVVILGLDSIKSKKPLILSQPARPRPSTFIQLSTPTKSGHPRTTRTFFLPSFFSLNPSIAPRLAVTYLERICVIHLPSIFCSTSILQSRRATGDSTSTSALVALYRRHRRHPRNPHRYLPPRPSQPTQVPKSKTDFDPEA